MKRAWPNLGASLLLATCATACDGIDLERMIDQPSFRAYEADPGAEHGMAMRHPPEGTVPLEQEVGPPGRLTGEEDGAYLERVPLPLERALLRRGRDRYRVYCAVCHGHRGDGRSQVAENMRLVKPPSLLQARYRDYPAGRLYRVVDGGFGLMPAYGDALDVEERWAVVAWVRVLQASQRIPVKGLPDDVREEVERWLR